MAGELQRFLTAMSEGVSEQADRIAQREGEETDESLALRDYFSQLIAVAEETDEEGVVDWTKLDDRVGIDLDNNGRT